MSPPYPTLFSLQQLVVELSLIDRGHYLAKTSRRENDIEHSMAVALLCWYIHDKQDLKLDIAKILKYALSHDFVECYAGDTNTFASTEARQEKSILEAASLKRLSTELIDFQDLVVSMHAYESKQDDEAMFVWTVDKMQQLIMGDLDNWRPYKEDNISYDKFVTKFAQTLGMSSKYCQEIFEGLIEYCKTTYYDRPRK